MDLHTFNVLFLCTGNSARSIFAEAMLNHLGAGRFRGYSAGSHPRGEVHPLTIRCLENSGAPIAGLHSKGWEEFAGPQAPSMQFVITVCDQAAGEICPVWPGQPMTAGQTDCWISPIHSRNGRWDSEPEKVAGPLLWSASIARGW